MIFPLIWLRVTVLLLRPTGKNLMHGGQPFRCRWTSRPVIGRRALTHETVRAMINFIVTDLLHTTRTNLAEHSPADINAVRAQPQPLVAFSDDVFAQHMELKGFLNRQLYRHPRVLEMTGRADLVIRGLFALYFNDPAIMPEEFAARAAEGEAHAGDAGRARAVADYIAGMTDRYAIAEHSRVFAPGAGT